MISSLKLNVSVRKVIIFNRLLTFSGINKHYKSATRDKTNENLKNHRLSHRYFKTKIVNKTAINKMHIPSGHSGVEFDKNLYHP